MPRIRFSCLQSTFCRLKETVTLPQATNLVKPASQLFQSRMPQGLFSPSAASHASSILKGEGVRCVGQDAVAHALKVLSRSAGLFQPMKQPLSFDSPEREAARQTRSL